MRSPQSNLLVRVLTAAVGIPLVLGADFLGGWPFSVLIAALALVGALELYAILGRAGARPFAPLGLAATVATAVIPLFWSHPQTLWIGLFVGTLFLGSAYFLMPAHYPGGGRNLVMTLIPIIYVGLLAGHLSLLRGLNNGARWVLVVLLITWAYDTGAYAAGASLGHRPFLQHVSPRKTVEGVAGGLLLAVVVSLVASSSALPGLTLFQALLLGLGGGAVAQLGDLFESMIKRQTGVKDSGFIIPGHGGLLDRIDSLLFAGAFAYYFALVFGYAS